MCGSKRLQACSPWRTRQSFVKFLIVYIFKMISIFWPLFDWFPTSATLQEIAELRSKLRSAHMELQETKEQLLIQKDETAEAERESLVVVTTYLACWYLLEPHISRADGQRRNLIRRLSMVQCHCADIFCIVVDNLHDRWPAVSSQSNMVECCYDIQVLQSKSARTPGIRMRTCGGRCWLRKSWRLCRQTSSACWWGNSFSWLCLLCTFRQWMSWIKCLWVAWEQHTCSNMFVLCQIF